MTFSPGIVKISAITQANPGVVTTSTNHNLTTGQVVRMNIPKAYGMQELNMQLAVVTVISNVTFSMQKSQCDPTMQININTTNYQAFVNAGTGTPAAFVAVGSAPTPITNVAWQIQNKACDSLINDATVNISTVPIPF